MARTADVVVVVHRIPAMEGATLARGYRAFDLYSLDRHAILDRVDGLDGLYLATAFSGTGFKIAPAVGVGMAELILDGQARTVDLRAFGLRRFREGGRSRAPTRTPRAPGPSAGTTPPAFTPSCLLTRQCLDRRKRSRPQTCRGILRT
ncbi:MAG: hypothetical protein HY359_03750 [Candidatus Rokubacteria bacterium]|nr:hypothetical protein [Candidatus Rokubacteria bacterium]